MRQSRRFTLTALKEYEHTKIITIPLNKFYISYNQSAAWTNTNSYGSLDGRKNVIVGYGHEWSGGNIIPNTGHPMAIYVPFTLNISGNLQSIDVYMHEAWFYHEDYLYNWGLSLTPNDNNAKGANHTSQLSNAYYPLEIYHPSRYSTNGNAVKVKNEYICTMTNPSISQTKELYFYLWTRGGGNYDGANIHFFDGADFVVKYKNNNSKG